MQNSLQKILYFNPRLLVHTVSCKIVHRMVNQLYLIHNIEEDNLDYLQQFLGLKELVHRHVLHLDDDELHDDEEVLDELDDFQRVLVQC